MDPINPDLSAAFPVLIFPLRLDKNGRIFFWDELYLDIMAQLRAMRLQIPLSYSPEGLHDQIIVQAKDKDILETGFIQLVFFRSRDKVLAWCFPNHQSNLSELRLGFWREKIWQESDYSDYMLYQAVLESMKVYQAEADADDLLLLDQDKNIGRSILGKPALIKQGKIQISKGEQGCLSPHIKKILFDFLEKEGLEIEEKPIKAFEIPQADEAFILNNHQFILPIKKFLNKELVYDRSAALRKKFLDSINLSLDP